MSYFQPLERVGPYIVVVTQSLAISSRKRKIVVRCMACERISILSERTLSDKRIDNQNHCQKCRNYRTRTTWTTQSESKNQPRAQSRVGSPS